MFQKNITREEILELPLQAFNGPVHVIDNIDQLDSIMPQLLEAKMLGFDTETKPSFKKGAKNQNKVALLQLSTETDAYLIRINKVGLPKPIAAVLADPETLKVGVAVSEDIRYLRDCYDFEPEGFVDLQSYVKDFGIESSGLKKLVAIILNFRISKTQQLSNWENEELSSAQLRYASTDAWVCHKIYNSL